MNIPASNVVFRFLPLGLALSACAEPIVTSDDVLARIRPPFLFGTVVEVSDCPSNSTLVLAEVRDSVSCLSDVCESQPSTVPVVIPTPHVGHRVLTSGLGHERDGDTVILDPPVASESCGRVEPVQAELLPGRESGLYVEDGASFCSGAGWCFESEDVEAHVRSFIPWW
jgi:hypothetical protein